MRKGRTAAPEAPELPPAVVEHLAGHDQLTTLVAHEGCCPGCRMLLEEVYLFTRQFTRVLTAVEGGGLRGLAGVAAALARGGGGNDA